VHIAIEMDINFYWVLFFLALVLLAAIGFGLSAFVKDDPFAAHQRVEERSRRVTGDQRK
jgi:hypothetical protein